MLSRFTLPPWLARTDAPSLDELIDSFDLWAYTCCTVVDREGREVPFIENAMQRRVNQIEDEMRSQVGHAWLYQLKMRRGGLSMNTQLRNLWRVWRKPNVRGITLAHEDESTREIFQITRLARDRFPEDLLPPMSREQERAVNFIEMGSKFLTGTAGSKGLGRGSDYSFLHISEFAFVPDPKTLHTSASQALRADGTYIRETTASSYGSYAHTEYQEAKAGRSAARAVFFEWWWRDDAYLPLADSDELEPLDDEEREVYPRIVEFQVWYFAHYLQIAPDIERVKRRALSQLKWRRWKVAQIGLDDFNREYPKDDTSCWLVAGTPYFDRKALQWMRTNSVRDPIRRDWNGELRIYKEPDNTKRYLIGGDPAEGKDNDRSAFSIHVFDSLEQVACFSSRTVPPEGLADRMAEMGMYYQSPHYGPAVLIPEVNSSGHTLLYQLTRVRKPAYRIDRIWHRTQLVKNVVSDVAGWWSSEESKYIALDDGAQIIREGAGKHLIRDQETLEDLLSVQRGKTGKVELTGKDLAVSVLLAWQGRKHRVAGKMAPNPETGELSEAAAASRRRF